MFWHLKLAIPAMQCDAQNGERQVQMVVKKLKLQGLGDP